MLRALRALALGYDCRALRALPLRVFHKLPSWGTERIEKVFSVLTLPCVPFCCDLLLKHASARVANRSKIITQFNAITQLLFQFNTSRLLIDFFRFFGKTRASAA